MRRSGTSALLQKANAQLRGERVPIGKAQEDEVGEYLSQLNRKAGKQPNWDKFGELSDISISDDSEIAVKKTPVVENKFMKKKPAAAESVAVKAPAVGLKPKQNVGVSSALSKAAAFQAKYAKPRQNVAAVLSDSDLDMDFSLDEDVLSTVPKAHQATLPTQAHKAQNELKPTVQQDSTFTSHSATERPKTSKGPAYKGANAPRGSISKPSLTKQPGLLSDDDSVSLGKGGNKFLKKKPAVAEAPPPLTIPTTADKAESKPKASKKAGIGLKSAEKYSTQVVLDTDEESLADFIQGLSSSSAVTVTPPKTPRAAAGSARKPRVTTPRDTESSRHSPAPVAKHQETAIIPDDDDDSIRTDDSFKLNVHDFQDLEPVAIQPKPSRKETGIGTKSSKAKPASSTRGSEEKKNAKQAEKDIFRSFGLQTLDDLGLEEQVISEVDSVSPQPLKSILTTTPRPITPKSSRSRVRYSFDEITEIRSRSPSPDPISTARQVESVIYTDEFEDPTETIRTLQTESDRTDSIETTVESRSPSPSSRRERYKSVDYTEDFTESSSHSESERSRSPSPSYSSDSHSYSDTYTSVSSSPSTSRSSSPVEVKKVKTRTRDTQTLPEPGLWYHWNLERGSTAILSQQYGLADVDPTPIATHTVSADALEAMTSYSPSVLAMNEMLKQQLNMTRQFIEDYRHMHRMFAASLTPDHQYTTLEDTRKYMQKHRKPKLTFDEALRQVKEEMGLT